MKVVFLGVGEACDERYPNVSIWLRNRAEGADRSILLECGFTVPPLYWRHVTDPNELDAVWISHFHGDHCFGVPAMLLRFWEMGRTRPLTVIGREGIESIIVSGMELAFPKFMSRFEYPLEFVEAAAGRDLHVVGHDWSFAENGHGQPDLAVKITDGNNSVFYSGDGAATPESLNLARSCGLVIHESYMLEEVTAGHATVRQNIEFAGKAGAGILALVHVKRDERRKRSEEILQLAASVRDIRVSLPEPGDMVEL